MCDQATLAKLAETTTFTADELNNMFQNYTKIAASIKDDKLIDRQEFQKMMAVNGNTTFIDGLFRMFDRNCDNAIDFVEFVTSLAMYQNKAKNMSDAEKQRVFFKFYDADNDGMISESDLSQMLQSCFETSFMQVPPEDVKDLVKATFAKYDCHGGKIDITSYSKHAFSHKSGYI